MHQRNRPSHPRFVQYAYGLVIEDSTNVLLEGVFDDGDYVGGISPPDGGDQTANLVITGTSSDVYLKNVAIREGAGEFHSWVQGKGGRKFKRGGDGGEVVAAGDNRGGGRRGSCDWDGLACIATEAARTRVIPPRAIPT